MTSVPSTWLSENERRSNLTRAQYLIWSGQELNPEVPLYNMAVAFRWTGTVDISRFAAAFQRLVQETDAMRMVFTKEDSVPTSMFLQTLSDPLEIVDLTAENDPDGAAERWLERDSRTLFDLGERSFRSALLLLGADRYVWYLNQHHLTTDGWSLGVIYRRMASLYSDPVAEAVFPEFRLYSEHERSSRDSPTYTSAMRFWSEKTEEVPPTLSFYGTGLSSHLSTRTDRLTLRLDEGRSAKIRGLVTGDGSSLDALSEFDVVATMLLAYLSRATGEDQISILTPVHSRPSQQLKKTAGLFIEVVPFSTEVNDADTFRTLLTRVSDESLEVLSHTVPGISRADINRSRSVLLNFINASLGPFGDLAVETDWIHPDHGDADHALRLQVHDFDGTGEYVFHFDLDVEVFDMGRAGLVLEHFELILDAMLRDPDQQIKSVSLMSSGLENELLETFNDTAAIWEDLTVLDSFRRQVAANPDGTAVQDGEKSVTYAEVDRLSDALAAILDSLVAGLRVRTVLLLDRSIEYVISVLGTLKAGGSFVPIDPDTPEYRISHLIADSSSNVLLTRKSHWTSSVDIPVLDPSQIKENSDTAMRGDVVPEDVAYVLYTSGSTGEPKGVVVSHGALNNYVMWASDQYGGGEPLDLPLYSSIGFDLTLTSVFVPLATGGTIVVYPDRADGLPPVVSVFDDDCVDVVKLTPSHLSVLGADHLETRQIKTLILGGEDLKSTLAREVAAANPELVIYNEYGPTEATVGCMIHRFDPEIDVARSVPIGRPIANSQIYILDEAQLPVPVGVVGELCIAGAGLAEGYLNLPELSSERFPENPNLGRGRLYRTGDRARWTVAGDIEFLGRSDSQVKIRGHRIELGEVAATLSQHPDIGQVLVDVVEAETTKLASRLDGGCLRCGLAPNAPGGVVDDSGVCVTCHFFEDNRDNADRYFRTPDELEDLLGKTKSNRSGQDCLMLLSGGKDSTYALYQLVEMGMTPLVFTLDNGFISDGAKANMRSVCDDLNLELVVAETPGMNAMFADSLTTFSNVCQGCFKTIYTLALNLASERDIDTVVTGLSRGQIFETRLADLFRIGVTEPDEVDEAILEARKAYHRAGGVASEVLPCQIFETDDVFETIRVIDFYRFVDVGLSEVFQFLSSRAPWVRPSDTGRSTNCLINATGIFVHKKERGYHNYAIPYAWDVRLGHKTRQAALEELDDEIDIASVRETLDEVGYSLAEESAPIQGGPGLRIVAYYVAESQELRPGGVRGFLSERLPAYMIPSFLVEVDKMPLTRNGKVDRSRLPDPRHVGRSGTDDYKSPRNNIEKELVDIWQSLLQVDEIGIFDNFFELGGDSIINIQIVARARKQGLIFTPQALFESRTIGELSRAVVLDSKSREDETESATPAIDPSIDADELADIISRYGN